MSGYELALVVLAWALAAMTATLLAILVAMVWARIAQRVGFRRDCAVLIAEVTEHLAREAAGR